MKHLKTFEAATQAEIERIHSEIENKYIIHFNSSEDFDEFILDVNNADDLDDVDWEHVNYDVIQELGLDYPELSQDELEEEVDDVMASVDLDDYHEIRGVDYDTWYADMTMKKNANKYNL